MEYVQANLKDYLTADNLVADYGNEFVSQLEDTQSLFRGKLTPSLQNVTTQKNLLELVAVGVDDQQFENIEPLEVLIDRIEIPIDANLAISQIRETIGYQIADQNVEAAKFNKYASIAKSTTPVVTAQIGHSRETFNGNLDPELIDSDTNSVSINVNYNLGVSNYFSTKAAAQQHEAAKMTRETLYRESVYSIRNAYIQLDSLAANYIETRDNLNVTLKRLNEVSDRIKQKQPVDLRSALASIGILNEMWIAYANALTELFLARSQMAATYGYYSNLSIIDK